MTDNLVLKIKENAERVDKELGKLFEGSRDEDIKVIFDAEKYSLLGGGKRIRAFITIEVCRMQNGEFRMQNCQLACCLPAARGDENHRRNLR